MKYTKKIPTKPGWYWVRYIHIPGANFIARIGREGLEENGPITFIVAPKIIQGLLADNRFEYAGPIEEPEE